MLHPTIRRTVRLLGASRALAWLTGAMVAGPGSAAYVRLSGRLGDAGHFVTIYFLATAVGGALAAAVPGR